MLCRLVGRVSERRSPRSPAITSRVVLASVRIPCLRSRSRIAAGRAVNLSGELPSWSNARPAVVTSAVRPTPGPARSRCGLSREDRPCSPPRAANCAADKRECSHFPNPTLTNTAVGRPTSAPNARRSASRAAPRSTPPRTASTRPRGPHCAAATRRGRCRDNRR
jgi:hypothetical protein